MISGFSVRWLVRFGVDALLLSNREGYRRSGVARYVDRLLAALPGALGLDELVTYLSPGIYRDSARNRHMPVPVERPSIRIAWEHVALPVMARRDQLDLFHGPVNVVPRGLPCPSVVTVHDLAFLRYPETVPRNRYLYLSFETRSTVKRAERVIAVSEATKRDIVELLKIDPGKVEVVPLGVDARFRPASEREQTEFDARYRIDKPFLLTVGNLEPRKNLPRLLEAFAMVAPKIEHDLVMIGAEGWLTGELRETLSRLRLDGRVKMTGFMDDADLPRWYAAADLFVFPSLYEGFGLPVIEAMACGTPVLASATSSLPEVAGGAAVLFDPLRIDAIADAIVQLSGDTAQKAELARMGMARALAFTWSATAEQTIRVYREAAA
jgi:glycosyltransferase involved in cell wall biosynthesis